MSVEEVLLGLEAGAAHDADALDAVMPGSKSPEALALAESLGARPLARGRALLDPVTSVA